jgi:hypothetical protein
MKAMIYVIRFEESLGLGDIEGFLKEIKSPIRLEIGDKITLSIASFDRTPEDDIADIIRMKDLLLPKSWHSTNYTASFEISDITYNNEYYYRDDEIKFYGIITLKGK